MTDNRTLRAAFAASDNSGASLLVHRARIGAAVVSVRLLLARTSRGVVALAVAEHEDPEGHFTEAIDARHVLDGAGESALSRDLASLRFTSTTPVQLSEFNDLAGFAPAMLDH